MAEVTIKIKLEDWLNYLEGRVNLDIYIYGGNGEKVVTLLPKIKELEIMDHTNAQALTNIDRLLTLLQKRLLQDINIFDIRGVDCSGLAIYYLLKKKIITSDMTANGLYKLTKENGKEIPLEDVRAGDYLFDGSDSKKWHVGYAVSEKYAIESKDHDSGVVKTVIANRPWKYAVRPNWYEGVEPEPTKPVLTRELMLENPMMRGDDVEDAQTLLTGKGYDCGTPDGVFGKKTDKAVRTFQNDKGLTVDGIIGKITAKKLGFIWKG